MLPRSEVSIRKGPEVSKEKVEDDGFGVCSGIGELLMEERDLGERMKAGGMIGSNFAESLRCQSREFKI